MKKRVKQYSDEVKKNAVDAVLTAGMTVTKAAKKFKVGRSTLHNWVATEVRAKIKKKDTINVKPRMLTEREKLFVWNHPNQDYQKQRMDLPTTNPQYFEKKDPEPIKTTDFPPYVSRKDRPYYEAAAGFINPVQSSSSTRGPVPPVRPSDEKPKDFNHIRLPYIHTNTKIETLDFIEDKSLDYNLGRAVSLIIKSHHGADFEKKDCLMKALYLIERKLNILNDK